MSVPTLARPHGAVAVNLYVPIALSVIVGIDAGYGAAKTYPRPFDMVAAAEPKIPAPPSAGSAQMPAQYSPQANQSVPVIKPRSQSVSSYAEITGNAAAVNAVKLVARVEGYLEKIHYEDGQFVKKGDLLFTIQQAQ